MLKLGRDRNDNVTYQSRADDEPGICKKFHDNNELHKPFVFLS